MDDWQETAFNNRRIPHGRSGRGGGGGGGGGKGANFDPRKAFGVYELKGAPIERLTRASSTGGRSIIEIHGLTDGGDALVASIEIPGAMKGMLLMAGSRRVLQRSVRDADPGDDDNGMAGSSVQRGQDGGGDDDDDEDDDDGGSGGSDAAAPEQPGAFDKNTFRSPKFWVQWRALVTAQDSGASKGNTDTGYFIFARNDCKSFRGTINCPLLGWKNASVTGYKISPKFTDCLTDWTDVPI